MKLVYIGDSKSPAGNGVWVRLPPSAQVESDKAGVLAYVIGVALGDGNLSCPNGRATRLRITCDAKYPKIAKEIQDSLRVIFPKNKVSVVPRTVTYFDISVYSNQLNTFMPWTVGAGSKAKQNARVPQWIREDVLFVKQCLKGLIQTDGCIYEDRGYKMVNFTNNNEALAEDAHNMLLQIGFRPSFMKVSIGQGRYKYTTRIARDTEKLIKELALYKA